MSNTRNEAVTQAAYHVLKSIPSMNTPEVVTVAMAIAAAVEVGLAWKPERLADPFTAALPPAQWSCGCSAAECSIRWDTYNDAGTRVPRQQGVRATCITHALVARTVTDVAEGHSLTYARARAMAHLDAAHAEQCR